METFLRRNFKVKGNIACVFKPNTTASLKTVAGIEVQLWHKAPMAKIFLGKASTNEDGDFSVEFEADSPVSYIVDGKISDVFLEAYYGGVKLEEDSIDLLNGLVAYWKFDESSGTTAADATGNSHAGTLSGTVLPAWTTGKINNGLELFGSSDGSVSSFIEVPSSPDFDFGSGDFTYSLWAIMNNTTYYFSLIDTGYSSTDSLLLEFSVSNTLKIIINAAPVYEKSFVADTSEWTHVVVRRISGKMEVFINNISLGEEPFTGNVGCPADFVIGKFFGGGENLDGKLDEIGVWKGHGLTNDEISILYNAGSALQYPFS